MSKKKKEPQKRHFLLIAVLIFIFLGCAGGYFLGEHIVKNDKFEVIGEKTIVLTVGQDYVEQGVNVIALGKKVANDKIKIKSDVDTTKAGNYIVEYRVNHIRFKNVVKYRAVIVKESEASA